MRKRPGLLAGIIGTLLILPAASRAEWAWRHPSPTANTLTALGQGAGLYVAVGKAGTVVVSPDGRAWESVPSGLSVDLHAVAYGGGKFVAAGSHGTLAWSADGRRWTWGGEPAAAFGYASIAWNGRRFIAVSDSPGVPAAWSEDGTAWIRGGREGGGHSRIACTEKLCMAAGHPGRISVTSDGIAWEARTAPHPDRSYGVGRSGEGFAAYSGSNLYRTEDGTSWSPEASVGMHWIHGLAPYRGKLMVVGVFPNMDGYPADGVLLAEAANGGWQQVGRVFRYVLQAVLIDGERVMAVGENGNILSAEGAGGFSRAGHRLTEANLIAIAGSGSRLVVLDNAGRLLFGTDDSTWMHARVAQAPGRSSLFSGLAWSGSRFVAVGSGIATSTDGVDWTWTPDGAALELKSVVWSGDRFVAVAQTGESLVSPDGVAWRQGQVQPSHRAGVGRLVWTGSETFLFGSDIQVSRDGLAWTSMGYSGPEGMAGGGFSHMAASRGVLLARTNPSFPLVRSTDGGLTWEKVAMDGFPQPLAVFSIASGFAVITRGAGGTGVHTLHLSSDGLAWSHVDVPMEKAPLGILETGGRLILVGPGGAILSAPKALLPFSVGIRKPASQRRLSRPVDPRRSSFPWRGGVFDAAGRSSPPP